MSITERLNELGLTLPPATTPMGSYVGARQVGDLLYLSGHVAKQDGKIVAGRVGAEIDVDTARQLARAIALDLIATAAAAAGGVEHLGGVAKVLGLVRSADGFDQQPAVINGASDLLVEVFGERGRHARSAIGVSELPGGTAVEIEAIFELG